MKEYIIWGKENDQAQYEALLVSEQAGIKTMKQAQDTVKKLEGLGCVDVRIQVFDFTQDVQSMFTQAINI